MQINKALIFFLLCTLQASDIIITTSSNSVSSSSSPSSSSQVASSQLSDNITSSYESLHEKWKNISKLGMYKADLPIELLDYIIEISSNSPMELIFNPKISSLDEWAEAAKKLNLPAMFKTGSGKKRIYILVAISRWLIKQEEERFLNENLHLLPRDDYWVEEILNKIIEIIDNEKSIIDNLNENNPERNLIIQKYEEYFKGDCTSLLGILSFLKSYSVFHFLWKFFCLDHYIRFNELYKTENNLKEIKKKFESEHYIKIFGSENCEKITMSTSLAELKEVFKIGLPQFMDVNSFN